MELIQSLTPEQFMERSDEVSQILLDEAVRAQIPLISNWRNFNGLKDLQVVRFRGLVQNMLDPEIYLEKYQTKGGDDAMQLRNGKYRDNFRLAVSVSCAVFFLCGMSANLKCNIHIY